VAKEKDMMGGLMLAKKALGPAAMDSLMLRKLNCFERFSEPCNLVASTVQQGIKGQERDAARVVLLSKDGNFELSEAHSAVDFKRKFMKFSMSEAMMKLELPYFSLYFLEEVRQFKEVIFALETHNPQVLDVFQALALEFKDKISIL